MVRPDCGSSCSSWAWRACWRRQLASHVSMHLAQEARWRRGFLLRGNTGRLCVGRTRPCWYLEKGSPNFSVQPHLGLAALERRHLRGRISQSSTLGRRSFTGHRVWRTGYKVWKLCRNISFHRLTSVRTSDITSTLDGIFYFDTDESGDTDFTTLMMESSVLDSVLKDLSLTRMDMIIGAKGVYGTSQNNVVEIVDISSS